jgi:tetratricopeptide (TPR) repeat protein
LAVSYDKIGNVLVDQGHVPEALKSYQAAHDVFDRLAKADPGNAGWQSDLAVSYSSIGNVLMAQGYLPEALKSYHASHDLLGVAKADPGNAGWQSHLAVSYSNIGDALVAQGQVPEALNPMRRASRSATARPRPILATPTGRAV